MTSLVANGLGLGVGSVFSNAQRAAAMLPVVILPFMLFGGIYSNLGTMPKWISWLQYLSVNSNKCNIKYLYLKLGFQI